MNYIEFHIGDYAEATAHLTFIEDAAYIRMLRKYYSTEKPLPADLKAVQRLVSARTKEEREAVGTVLNEFFTLQDDGWHNSRCDAELARFKDGKPEREVKKANEENRLKRHREERARLFKALTDAGQHAPWNIGMNELRDLVKKLPATAPETGLPPLPATAPATPATATQSPITNTQTPVLKTDVAHVISAQPELGADDERDHPSQKPQRDRNVQISMLLNAQGVGATAMHPTVACTWAQDDRVTDTVLNAAIAKAKATLTRQGRGDDVSIGYLEPIVAQLLAAPPASLQAVPGRPEKFNPTAYVNRNRIKP